MLEFVVRRDDDGTTVIEPHGQLNMLAAPRFRQLITDVISHGDKQIVVELSATNFMDSSGLGALVFGLKSAREAGGDLRIAAPTDQISAVLALTKLDTVFTPYESAHLAYLAV